MTSADLTADEFTAAVAAVTSAFGDPTRRAIYLFIRSADEGVTASEVAGEFDLHANVARHHLEKLAAGGYLDVELARHSTAGRPSKRYRASTNDTHLSFPPRRDDLLATLLARALVKLPPDEARELAEEVGYEYGRSIAARMEPTEGHRSVKAAVASVADALTAHGFAAHTEAHGDRLTLVSEHCPFGEAAQRWPHVLCAVDTGMVRGMLEGLYGKTTPTLTESRPDGGEHCVTARLRPDVVAVRAYLDHASTAPLRPEARAAMAPYLDEIFGDPGRLHAEGRATRVALEHAREQVAHFFGARPREVVFTSSGTEAVNHALWHARDHVVTTAVEHSCVRDALERSGAEVTVVAVDRVGRVDVDAVLSATRADTTLVSVQLANHEVGTVQPVAPIAAALREHGVLLHVDACAAAGHMPVAFAADLCSVTAHKFGGPLGAGALLVRRGLRIPPLIVGGAQERARRGGIENLPAWIGFGAACAATDVDAEATAARALIDAAAVVVDRVPGVTRFGNNDLPNLLCLGIEGVEAEPILLALDQHGVAVHSGSACSSEMLAPSPVLQAMGVDADRSLRISVGWSTRPADVERFVEVFPGIIERLRGLRSA